MPSDQHGNPVPSSEYPHTQLGTRKGRKGEYTQGREWDYNEDGKLEPKRLIEFTDHGRPNEHTNPHQHKYLPNKTGGTPKHGKQEPVEMPK